MGELLQLYAAAGCHDHLGTEDERAIASMVATIAARWTHPDAGVSEGALPADDLRSRATLAAVTEQLVQDGYRYRPDDRPLGSTEGAFLMCGFAMSLAQLADGNRVEAYRRGAGKHRPPCALNRSMKRGRSTMNDSKTAAQGRQRSADLSPIDEKDRHDILTQQIIDDLARSSRDRQHEQVVDELAIRLSEENLPAKPRPWLDAVAAEAITGNAYVVTATTARASDVPQPNIDRSGKAIK